MGKAERHCLLIGVGALLAHATTIALPEVNREFAFVDAARYFGTGAPVLLEEYFHYQANSVALPALAAWLSRPLPEADLLLVERTLAGAGIAAFAWGVLRLARFLGRQAEAPALLALLVCNPLVWIYSGRATADFLPAALGLLAATFCLEASTWTAVCGGLLLGCAGVLKLHVLLMLAPLAGLLLAIRPPVVALRRAALATAVSASVTGAALAAAHARYGFWLTPPGFQEIHRVSLSGMPVNFLAYASFLSLLTLPMSAAVPGAWAAVHRHRWLAAASATGAIALGALVWHDNGEMNLGPLDAYLNPTLVGAAFAILSMGLAVPLLGRIAGADAGARPVRLVGIATIFVLLVLSLSRPAQRYLLFVLPFYALVLPGRVLRSGPVVLGCAALFIAADAFIGYSQWCTGTAARIMRDRIVEAGWLLQTDPGAIEAHVGDAFFKARAGPRRYTVVAGSNPQALLSVRAGTWAGRTFSLVPIAPQTVTDEASPRSPTLEGQ